MDLDPEFKSFSDRNLFFILVFQRFELFEVARIIDIQDSVFRTIRIIAIVFDPVIHMIADTDFLQSHVDRVLDKLFDRIVRIVAEFRVQMIVCFHKGLFSSFLCFKVSTAIEYIPAAMYGSSRST